MNAFSGSEAMFDVAEERTFGCPVHVLDDSSQCGKKIPKWDSRIRVGICAGKSPFHAGSVSLAMNKDTGLISPQYHCIYDDNFTAVPALRCDMHPPNWEDLTRSSTSFIPAENFIKTVRWQLEEPNLLLVSSDSHGFGHPAPSPDTLPPPPEPNACCIQLISDPFPP